MWIQTADVSDFVRNLLTHYKTVQCKQRLEVRIMAANKKQTSKVVATKASKVLRDNRYSKTSKSVAGSALAQTRPGKRK